MLSLSFLLSTVLLAYAQSPFLLGNFPVAVKTPYLHTWISSHGQTALVKVWPSLYTNDKLLGWVGIIRVDGQDYEWLGATTDSNFSASAVASHITPTKSIFNIHTGPVKFNATFFSPIEPSNYTRQSIPFTYLFVDGFTADDAEPHTIQLYSHITAEWVSHEKSTQVAWDTKNSSNIVYHHVEPKDSKPMVKNADSAEDATGYYATPNRPGLTWRTGNGAESRNMFLQNGTLSNSKDTAFRAVSESWPSFSFAIDLGPITRDHQPDPVVWALGLVRNPLVKFETDSGFQLRTGYYWSAYPNIDAVISDFLGDFASARLRAQVFDDDIVKAASIISSEYVGIVSLVTRQIFASMDITIPVSEKLWQPIATDVKIFMKDISVSTRVNPVEVIYAALPALLYFNPSFAHDLLLPLFEYQSSPSYSKGYALPDPGTGYPLAGGRVSATEELAIEHCGNMLIMAYAYAAKSGDGSFISRYYSLLRRWADYLVQNSLHPNNAISADDIGYPEMSNLALKGILGVYFMGKIDEVIRSSNTTFRDKANELFENWKQLAMTDTHIQAEYDRPDTWGLMYNLFPAVWLQTGLIDDGILNREAQFYLSNAPPGNQSYSLDNEKGRDIAYPHWALMTAAIIPPGFTSVRDILIQSTYLQAYNVSQKFPLPMRYTASTGAVSFGTTGSAAQGASFAILAMGMKNVAFSLVDSEGNVSTDKKKPLSAIVGGVIGGSAFLLICVAIIFFWRWRKARVIIDPYKECCPMQHPDGSQFPPILSSHSKPQPLESGMDRHAPVAVATTPLTREVLSSKQREVLRQIQPQSSPSAQSITDPALAAESRGNEMLRAEVEGLRREVEMMRNVAQPPPSYQ